MRWEDERYVRVYTRDTAEWVALGWEAQCLFMAILRKVDRAGILTLGKTGTRGLAGLLGAPLDLAERALPILIDDGCVQRTDTGLVLPNFIAAQETPLSDKARQREKRERDRCRAMTGSDVTNRDAGSRTVTVHHAESREITLGHGASLRAVPNHAVPNKKTNVGASDPGAVSGPLRGAGVSLGDDPGETDGEAVTGVLRGHEGQPAMQASLDLGESPASPPPRRKGHDIPAEAHALYVEGWRASGKAGSPPILDGKRRKMIRARLKDFGADDVLDAARGAWAPSWFLTKEQNSIDLVFRDSQNVERFRDFWRKAAASHDSAPTDPNDLPPTAVRYDIPPEPPVFREPRAEVIPSVVFGDDP